MKRPTKVQRVKQTKNTFGRDDAPGGYIRVVSGFVAIGYEMGSGRKYELVVDADVLRQMLVEKATVSEE